MVNGNLLLSLAFAISTKTLKAPLGVCCLTILSNRMHCRIRPPIRLLVRDQTFDCSETCVQKGQAESSSTFSDISDTNVLTDDHFYIKASMPRRRFYNS